MSILRNITLGLLSLMWGVGMMPVNANDDLLAQDRLVNIAHRGASDHAPEHTMAAYELAHHMGADYLEIDLQVTKDDQLVAIHDDTVNRTTNGTGYVRDYTLAQLKELDAGSWFNYKNQAQAKTEYVGLKILTLGEIIERFGTTTNYYIETKAPEESPGLEEKLLALLDQYHLLDSDCRRGQVIIQSFSPESLQKIHGLNPNIPLVELKWYENEIGHITDAELEAIKKYAIGIGPNFNLIDDDYIPRARAHGLLVHPYTLDGNLNMKRSDMEQMLKRGATGLFVNSPDVLSEVMHGK